MIFELPEELTELEVNKFLVPNKIEVSHKAYKCSLIIGAIYKDKGQFVFDPMYSSNLIEFGVKPTQLIRFAGLHKKAIFEEKQFNGAGRLITVYYANYQRKVPDLAIGEYDPYDVSYTDIELVLQETGYYSVMNIHLLLNQYVSILQAVDHVFNKQDDIKLLNGCVELSNDKYIVTYYDDYSNTKKFYYDSLSEIYKHIISVRVLKSEEYQEGD